jgi:hypothetical protein
VDPDFVVSSLGEAVTVIARETLGASATEGGPVSTEVETPAEKAPAPVETAAPATLKLTGAPSPAPVAPTPAPRIAPPAPVERESPPKPAREVTAPAPAPPSAPKPAPAVPPPSLERLEGLAEQILNELRHRDEQTHADFSVSKLMAGIVQVIALAVLFMAYFRGGDAQLITLVTALTLQCFTIALLIMGRQR